MYPGEEWPSEDTIFLFQVDLSTVPPEMQQVAGSSGLLQVFTYVYDWYEKNTLTRVIPAEDFDRLCKGPDMEETRRAVNDAYDALDIGELTIGQVGGERVIKGWFKQMDHYLGMQPSLPPGIETPSFQYKEKFWGYPFFVQGCGDEHFEPPTKCKTCEKVHLHKYCTSVFQLADDNIWDVHMGDAGTAQLQYCPGNPSATVQYGGACC